MDNTKLYYPINEATARRAKEMNSYSDYVHGSATAEYRKYVDEAVDIAERQKSRVDVQYHEKIDRLLVVYARKLADNMNKSFEIESRVPSVLIAGFSNFPVRKKEKQNAARDKNLEEWNHINGLLDKIKSTGMGGISADDPNAIKRLESKLHNQQKLQERMKSINAYYRKNKTLDGCPDLSAADIEQLKADMSRGFRIEEKPFPTWALSNNNAEIRRLKQRIEDIKRRDATDYKGWNFDGGTVKPNKDINRLQIFFDDKPDADIRAELKSNGFRWAPSEGAWQRQLTDNALYAAKHLKVIEPIADNELQEENTDISQTLNELTADEKQAIVDGVEFALDCNLADTVPQSDMDLYNAIIKERSEQKPSIKEALQTAKEQAAKQPAAQPSQKKEDISL